MSGTHPWKSAARGGIPPGTTCSGARSRFARAASSPPEDSIMRGTPRSFACSSIASVSSVFPEYDDSTRSVFAPTQPGSA